MHLIVYSKTRRSDCELGWSNVIGGMIYTAEIINKQVMSKNTG